MDFLKEKNETFNFTVQAFTFQHKDDNLWYPAAQAHCTSSEFLVLEARYMKIGFDAPEDTIAQANRLAEQIKEIVTARLEQVLNHMQKSLNEREKLNYFPDFSGTLQN